MFVRGGGQETGAELPADVRRSGSQQRFGIVQHDPCRTGGLVSAADNLRKIKPMRRHAERSHFLTPEIDERTGQGVCHFLRQIRAVAGKNDHIAARAMSRDRVADGGPPGLHVGVNT